jgi:hypothetical protein
MGVDQFGKQSLNSAEFACAWSTARSHRSSGIGDGVLASHEEFSPLQLDLSVFLLSSSLVGFLSHLTVCVSSQNHDTLLEVGRGLNIVGFPLTDLGARKRWCISLSE